MRKISIKLKVIASPFSQIDSAILLGIFDEFGKEYFGRCTISNSEINIIFSLN